MFQALRDRLEKDENGFTLIELLVVVIIIGILAAIAVPTFLSQREKAGDNAAKADLRNGAIFNESYNTDKGPGYPTDLATLQGEGFKVSGKVTFTQAGDSNEYCMSAKHGNGTQTWYLDEASSTPSATACSNTP